MVKFQAQLAKFLAQFILRLQSLISIIVILSGNNVYLYCDHDLDFTLNILKETNYKIIQNIEKKFSLTEENKCSFSNCGKNEEIEYVDETPDIKNSPNLRSKKCTGKFINKSFSKKAKIQVKKEKSSMLKKLIKELTSMVSEKSEK
ncbi:hypothetical protein Glove_673g49 [Diversispora epigaea]|uniref:Uncharacterized protein n=1 Tax=Diversispora epigaea TaxID=1348612 RepID=A0A397G857_9GLOM|nr:hypothetical protein Glove_673g49 [Diversispora epigaea]